MKNVILEISFRNDILLCNVKKGYLAILVHILVVVLIFSAGYIFHPFLVVNTIGLFLQYHLQILFQVSIRLA